MWLHLRSPSKTNTFAQLSEFTVEPETIPERLSYRFITRENQLYLRRVVTKLSGDVPLNSLSFQRRRQIITPLDEQVEQVLEAEIFCTDTQPKNSAIVVCNLSNRGLRCAD